MTTMQTAVGGGAAMGPAGLMERLKQETRELHTRAERGDVQKALVSGRATLEQYGAWLGQMSLLHGAVEEGIERLRAGDGGGVFGAIEAEWRQSRLGREDLDSLGMGEAIEALPATARVVEEIAACTSPLRVLGFFYVLEGANNGNRFIVRAVRKGLGLTPGTGDRFLDPYGEAQPAVWAGVKARLDAIGASLSAAERDEVVEGAARMFGMVIEVGEALAGE
jgi:heme oxygenase